MKKLFLVISLGLLFGACEKTSDIKIPENPPMMAVFGFVEEGRGVVIRLEEVVPVFGRTKRNPVPVSGAWIQVKEGANTYMLPELQGQPGVYSFHGLMGEAGKTYELEVKKAGFPDLQASCRVPDFVPNSVTHNYVAVPDPDGFTDSVRRAGFTWTDRKGSLDYYRFNAIAKYNGTSESIVQFVDDNMEDISKDGQDIFTGLGSFWIENSGMAITSLSINFELMALDAHAFKYMRTFDAAYYNDGNPFAEPVIMYSNVKGGTGVFGGVNRKVFNKIIY